VGGRPLLPEILGRSDSLEPNRRFSVDIRSQRLSGSTYQKVQLTLIGSRLRTFQWA